MGSLRFHDTRETAPPIGIELYVLTECFAHASLRAPERDGATSHCRRGPRSPRELDENYLWRLSLLGKPQKNEGT